MISNIFITVVFHLNLRLILYKYMKIIHGHNQHFEGADLQKEPTYNFVINQFLKGGYRIVYNVTLEKICSKISLLL